MPVYYVGKGRQFAVLDMFDGTEGSRGLYEATISKLNSDVSLLQLAQDRKDETPDSLSDTDIRHFDKDWLGTWWTGQHVALVLRNGIRRALELALDTGQGNPPLPVEALWVCADENVFHVYANKGPHQVTVIVYTPPPGRYAARESVLEESIWVIKARDDADGDYPVESEITRLTSESAWPVLIERQLRYTDQAGA